MANTSQQMPGAGTELPASGSNHALPDTPGQMSQPGGMNNANEQNPPNWLPQAQQSQEAVLQKSPLAPKAEFADSLSIGWIIFALIALAAAIAFFFQQKSRKMRKQKLALDAVKYDQNDRRLLELARLMSTIYKKT